MTSHFTGTTNTSESGVRVSTSRNAHLKNFQHHFSIFLQLQQCQYYYHIKQKCCIFFSSKAFYDIQKVLKRRLQPRYRPGLGRWSSRRSPDPLVGWEGGHPQFPLPSTPSASQYRWLRHLILLNPPNSFCIWPCSSIAPYKKKKN